jgi:hypothetical protein
MVTSMTNIGPLPAGERSGLLRAMCPPMDDPEAPDPRHERIARAVEGDHAGKDREPGAGAASTALERLARAGRALRASQVREAPDQAMHAEQAEQPGDSP